MVLRSFVSFSKFSSSKSSSYIPRRTSSSSSPPKYPFFKPSYLKQTEIVQSENYAGKKGPNNSTGNNYRTQQGSLYLSQKYIILDQSGNNNRNGSEEDEEEYRKQFNDFQRKILLKKSKSFNNKSNNVNIFIKSVDSNKTTLNIRRANSHQMKTLILNHNVLEQQQQQRLYSTTTKNDLISNFQTLNIHDSFESKTKEAKKSKLEKIVEEKEESVKETFKEVDNFTSSVETEYTVEEIISQHESMINSMLSMNKNNEVLSLYLRLKNKDILPSLSIYNNTLKSISLRDLPDESVEESLTHLLNVYSDMLSNNMKPNNDTYEIVISSLLQGSLKSYSNNMIQNGLDFFKIAMELFLINKERNLQMTPFPKHFYIDVLKCLNIYQITNSIKPMEFYNDIIHPIINNDIKEFDLNFKIEMYQGLLSFSKFFNDVESIEFFYGLLKTIDDDLSSKQQINTYSKVIESLLYCNEYKRSTIFLDNIIQSLDNSYDISKILSHYLIGLSFSDPLLSYDHLLRFNSNQHLPDVSVECLLIMMKNIINTNDLETVKKLWNFVIIRKDFDVSVKNYQLESSINEFNNYHGYIYNFLTTYVELLLASGNKSEIIKITREIMIKDSLTLEIPTLLKLIKYLNSQTESVGNDKLIINLIENQSWKNETTQNMRLNKFISYIIDFLTETQINQLFNNKLFKTTVEQYRLTTDSIYGIMKTINSIISSTKVDNITSNELNLKLNLKYFAKVLDYEFNDTTNHYVMIPDEIKNFRSNISQYI